MPNKPRDYVSANNIATQWIGKIDEIELNFDWSDAYYVCWSCGEDVKTQKCHIIPHSLDGGEEPENMVLLCRQCHLENPNTQSREGYIEWLKSRKNTANHGFGDYWLGRSVIEYENIYRSNYFSDLIKTNIDSNILQRILNYIKGNFKTSFAGKRHNPADMALVMKEVLLKCKDQEFCKWINTQDQYKTKKEKDNDRADREKVEREKKIQELEEERERIEKQIESLKPEQVKTPIKLVIRITNKID